MRPARPKPGTRSVSVTVLGRRLDLPAEVLLRALERLWPDAVARGPFCWKQECGSSKLWYRLPGDATDRKGRACRLVAAEGMEITQVSAELREVLREFLGGAPEAPARGASQAEPDEEPFPEPRFRDAD